MRNKNDEILANECPEIDLILGAHDHIVDLRELKNNIRIKSGCDCRYMSLIQIQKHKIKR